MWVSGKSPAFVHQSVASFAFHCLSAPPTRLQHSVICAHWSTPYNLSSLSLYTLLIPSLPSLHHLSLLLCSMCHSPQNPPHLHPFPIPTNTVTFNPLFLSTLWIRRNMHFKCHQKKLTRVKNLLEKILACVGCVIHSLESKKLTIGEARACAPLNLVSLATWKTDKFFINNYF